MYQRQIHFIQSTILTINQDTGQPFQLLKNSWWNHVAMEVIEDTWGHHETEDVKSRPN